MNTDDLTDEQVRLNVLEQRLDESLEALNDVRARVWDMQAGAYVQPSYVRQYAERVETIRKDIATTRDLFYGLEAMLKKRMDDEAAAAWGRG